MNDILRIARLKIALQRAFLGRAILRVIHLWKKKQPVEKKEENIWRRKIF